MHSHRPMTDINWDVEDEFDPWGAIAPGPERDPEAEPKFNDNTDTGFVTNSNPEGVSQEEFEGAWLAFLEKYEKDPVAFAEDILGIELMEHQKGVLRAVGAKKRRIAMRSGHRVGKTMLLSIIALWHLVVKYPQKTLVTAPTAGQLFDSLFAEIMTLSKRLPPFIRDLFDFYTDQIALKADPDGSFLSARTASPDKPESFQGIHSANLLVIWDEASGIDERLFNAARGSMAAPNALQILAGNPVKLNNTFHRAFTTNAELFEKFVISSVGLKTVDPDFIKEVGDTFGVESNEYRIRVLGEFPDTEDESYIPTSIVRAARLRSIAAPSMAAIVYGVDPARQGDDRTVITRRVGLHVIEDQKSLIKKNTMQVVGEIQQMALEDQNRLVAEFQAAGRNLLYLPPVPAAIVVDVIGIGAGVVDRLLELGYNVISVNAAETATSEPLCKRERDAIWKRARDWLEAGKCRIPDDDQLAMELTAAHYEYDSTGVLKIEGKKEMKKRVGRSPDKADSMMLSLMVPVEVITGFLKAGGPGGSMGYGSGPKGALSRASSAPTARR